MRAEFAMSTRRLEMSVEQLKTKTTSQLTEIGKKSDAIGRLKLELGEKTAALFALEAKERKFASELESLGQDEGEGRRISARPSTRWRSTQAELARGPASRKAR